MSSSNPHAVALARFRNWRGEVIIAIIAVLPAELGVGLPLSQRSGSSVPFVAVALLAAIVVVYASVRIWQFRCPRCAEPFASSSVQTAAGPTTYRNPFTSKCLNCGLPSLDAAKDMRPN